MKKFFLKAKTFFGKVEAKYGLDKLIKGFAAAWIMALFIPFGFLFMLIGFIAIMVISALYGFSVEDNLKLKDLDTTLIGCVSSVILYFPITLLANLI